MLAELTPVCAAVMDVAAAADPAAVSGVECAEVVALLARTEKCLAALRALTAARAAASGAHRGQGFSSPERWLGDTLGVSTGEARSALETVKALEQCPETKEALRAGAVSLGQAGEIAKTEAVAPGSESELLALAGSAGLGELKEEARRRRLAAEDVEELHRRQHRDRMLRHWQDDQGMSRGSWALPPEVGVALANRLDSEVERLARQARRDGRQESREQLAADALTQLILDGGGAGKSRARSCELVLVCDIQAFQRGEVEAGEVCHIIGGGPIPPSVARELAVAAFIKGVLHDGVRIDTVAHWGRYQPAELRTAVGLGAPPLFTGAACVGCGRRYGLQWDHVDPVAHRGATAYDNLQALCWPCHRDKTQRDRDAGLLKPRAPSGSDPP